MHLILLTSPSNRTVKMLLLTSFPNYSRLTSVFLQPLLKPIPRSSQVQKLTVGPRLFVMYNLLPESSKYVG